MEKSKSLIAYFPLFWKNIVQVRENGFWQRMMEFYQNMVEINRYLFNMMKKL